MHQREVTGTVRAGGIPCLLLALVLAGCGGGAATEAPSVARLESATLAIETFTLPSASVGVPYEGVQLQARGSGTIRWQLLDGVLPAGIDLGEDGTLHGTPTQGGVHPFTVRATDGVDADTRTLALAVDAFGLCAYEGLVAGEAWAGRPVRLCAAGQEGPVRFALPDPSVGTLVGENEIFGTVTFLPAAPVGAVDVVAVTAEDLRTGRQGVLLLDVRADPTAAFQALFGSTDVWYVDGSARTAEHGFATDLHAALAAIGFRGHDSFDAVGAPADQLAARFIRLQILRELSQLFLHEAEGWPGLDGLAVSLPHDEPEAPHARPAPGTQTPAGPSGYSAMRLAWRSDHGALATGILDTPWNESLEHVASADASGRYGVFLQEVVARFNDAFDNDVLPLAPVSEADVPALHALLHDLPDPGGRYLQLAHFGKGFARTVAVVCAHEMAHGMGLRHTEQADAGSIMNEQIMIGPLRRPRFLPADVEQLRTMGLPGANR